MFGADCDGDVEEAQRRSASGSSPLFVLNRLPSLSPSPRSASFPLIALLPLRPFPPPLYAVREQRSALWMGFLPLFLGRACLLAWLLAVARAHIRA